MPLPHRQPGHGSRAFDETTSTYGPIGQDTQGTESFTSNAGKIDQTFSYGPDVVGGFSGAVTVTRDLSFLTRATLTAPAMRVPSRDRRPLMQSGGRLDGCPLGRRSV